MATFSILNANVIRDNTGTSSSMRVLMSSEGPSYALIDYCLFRVRSRAWQQKLLRAAKLFLEYSEANSFAQDEMQLFRNFQHALSHGTVDPTSQDDPSGLFWRPIGKDQSNFMITQLSDFFDWLGVREQEGGANNKGRAEKYNPRYVGNLHDQHIDKQAYFFRRRKAFLGHTWHSSTPKVGRFVRREPPLKIFSERPPAFPEERFEELLFKGFKVGGKYNYRDMLITLLLFGGGLRASEPFHLFVADVQPHWENPENAFVAIHHPSLGLAPNKWRNAAGHRGSRREYLASEFGLLPRNENSKAYAGWKQPALDAHWYLQVHWFPEIYSQWFMQIWQLYMEQIVAMPRNHPYAWINVGDEPLGEMYQLRNYQAAFKAAVERIGLDSCKENGTTPHGCRHAYGQRAKRADIDPLIIQRMMHHCSLESQIVYKQPEIQESMLAIQNATGRLRDAFLRPEPISSKQLLSE